MKVVKAVSVPKTEHLSLQAYNRSVLQSVQKDTGFTYINLDDLFCDDDKCAIGDDVRSKYLDEYHLSSIGALSLHDAIKGHILKLVRRIDD